MVLIGPKRTHTAPPTFPSLPKLRKGDPRAPQWTQKSTSSIKWQYQILPGRHFAEVAVNECWEAYAMSRARLSTASHTGGIGSSKNASRVMVNFSIKRAAC